MTKYRAFSRIFLNRYTYLTSHPMPFRNCWYVSKISPIYFLFLQHYNSLHCCSRNGTRTHCLNFTHSTCQTMPSPLLPSQHGKKIYLSTSHFHSDIIWVHTVPRLANPSFHFQFACKVLITMWRMKIQEQRGRKSAELTDDYINVLPDFQCQLFSKFVE